MYGLKGRRGHLAIRTARRKKNYFLTTSWNAAYAQKTGSATRENDSPEGIVPVFSHNFSTACLPPLGRWSCEFEGDLPPKDLGVSTHDLNFFTQLNSYTLRRWFRLILEYGVICCVSVALEYGSHIPPGRWSVRVSFGMFAVRVKSHNWGIVETDSAR